MAGSLMRRAVVLALAAAAVMANFLLPQSARAQSLCHGQRGCHQGRAQPAGVDSAGQRLRVIVVSRAPSQEDPSGCSERPQEYWLLRGRSAPVRIGGACAGGHIDHISAMVGPNHLTTAFAAGMLCCYTNYETVYRLSPLRVDRQTACSSSAIDGHERWVQTTLDAQTLVGETLADIRSRAGATDEATGGCDPEHAPQRWLTVPRMTIDGDTLARTGAGLGDCAAVMGPNGGGYLLSGQRTQAEIRLLAVGPRSLLIQVADTAAAPASGPLSQRTHIEIWSSETSLQMREPAEDGLVSQILIDPADGSVERGVGADPLPRVRHWRAPLAGGRRAWMILVTFAPGELPDLDVDLAVVFHQVRDGRPSMVLASTQFRGPQASSLGETFDVSGFTHCAVRSGLLTLTAAGVVRAPFEAVAAGGLSRLH